VTRSFMIDLILDNDFLQIQYFGNTIANYIDAFFFFFCALAFFAILQGVLMSRFHSFAQKTATEIDDMLIEFIQSIRPQLYMLLSAYIAAHTLILHPTLQNVINILMIIAVIFQITRSLQMVVTFAAERFASTNDDEHVRSAAHLLSAILTATVWIFGVMMILSNIGVDITSLVAGVGITGIAIAFAVKEVLADLFSSFSIYFDKPFKAGDVVKIDNKIGIVKKIGIKTTRIESQTGEELIVPNQDMTSSRVHNYKKMEHRNVRINLNIAFDTPVEMLDQIPTEIKNIISHIAHAECKRVHLKDFGEWGLVYEIFYVVDSRDYMAHVNAKHEILLKIKSFLDDNNIQIAHPAQIDINRG
jgi:small-conductance mechanosensitive channel